MTTPSETPEWARRIATAAHHVEAIRAQLNDALATRDRAIVDAVDQGHSIRTVSRHAAIGHPSVVKVLAGSARFWQDTAQGRHD